MYRQLTIYISFSWLKRLVQIIIINNKIIQTNLIVQEKRERIPFSFENEALFFPEACVRAEQSRKWVG